MNLDVGKNAIFRRWKSINFLFNCDAKIASNETITYSSFLLDVRLFLKNINYSSQMRIYLLLDLLNIIFSVSSTPSDSISQ